MSDLIVQMSMSLDRYAAGPGDDVQCLHRWMFAGGGPGTGLVEADQEVFDELRGAPAELRQAKVTTSKEVTHLRYRIVRYR